MNFNAGINLCAVTVNVLAFALTGSTLNLLLALICGAFMIMSWETNDSK